MNGSILSERATPRVERLYAVVLVDDAGLEGIMRRDTPYGTQPWITDDAVLAKALPMMAAIDAGLTADAAEQLRLVEFARVDAAPSNLGQAGRHGGGA